MNDISHLREQFNVAIPPSDADQDAVLNYLWEIRFKGASDRSEGYAVMAAPPFISGFQERGHLSESLGRRDYLGFDLRNVDQTMLVPRTFLPDSPNQAGESIDSSRTVPLEIVRGRFDREATDQALVACYENSPLVLSTTVKKVVQRVSINGSLVEIGLADAQMAVEQGQATLERSNDNSVK